jgi:hypothetical protein
MKKLLLSALLIVACDSKIDWPKVLNCAAPAEQALLATVEGVLAGSGDVESGLTDVAKSYGPGAVECAVQEVVTEIEAGPRTAKQGPMLARGRGFLAKVQK